jgi:hypothetical protein
VIAQLVYLLCAATSVVCASLLLRSYLRNRTRLLMWSSISFVGLAINNILLFVDLAVVPDVDLSLWRATTALLAVMVLVVGLILESR